MGVFMYQLYRDHSINLWSIGVWNVLKKAYLCGGPPYTFHTIDTWEQNVA